MSNFLPKPWTWKNRDSSTFLTLESKKQKVKKVEKAKRVSPWF